MFKRERKTMPVCHPLPIKKNNKKTSAGYTVASKPKCFIFYTELAKAHFRPLSVFFFLSTRKQNWNINVASTSFGYKPGCTVTSSGTYTKARQSLVLS
jgi:hypothetical protein